MPIWCILCDIYYEDDSAWWCHVMDMHKLDDWFCYDSDEENKYSFFVTDKKECSGSSAADVHDDNRTTVSSSSSSVPPNVKSPTLNEKVRKSNRCKKATAKWLTYCAENQKYTTFNSVFQHEGTFTQVRVTEVNVTQLNIAEGTFSETNVFQGNLLQQNTLQQNTLQQNTFQQNTFQQNSFQQNNFQQNTLQQNTFQQNTFQQNNFQQNTFQQNTFQQNVCSFTGYPGTINPETSYPGTSYPETSQYNINQGMHLDDSALAQDPIITGLMTLNTDDILKSSKTILEWFNKHKGFCTSLIYPLPDTLFMKIKEIHNLLVTEFHIVPKSKKKRLIYKVYDDLTNMMLKHIKTKNSLIVKTDPVPDPGCI